MSISRQFILDSSVYFGRKSITILAKKSDKIENGVSFSVYDPLWGTFSHPWEPATYPPHLSSWYKESPKDTFTLLSSLHNNDGKTSNDFTLLVDRIKAGDVAWGNSFNITGESSFIDGYWEWLEDVLSRSRRKLHDALIYKAVYASLFSYDCNPKVFRAFCDRWCPSTNTLHTATGELSISLWDLHELGGLPIRGEIYDEVVPSIKELLDCDEMDQYYLPSSCQILFRAFAKLCNKEEGGQQVSISAWVSFWYRQPLRYAKPCVNVYRRDAVRPSNTRNPCGSISASSIRTSLDEEPFLDLQVRDSVKDEVYTAALLACWICKFVFPTQGGSFIRPSVFKAASLMAKGRQVSLAIPALANIYSGLRDISTSSDLKNIKTYLPVHYIYSWLGRYFDIHHYIKRPQNDVVLMAVYAGEKMGRYFSSDAASSLFDNFNLKLIYSLSLCEDNKRRYIFYNGTLPRYCSEYIVSQRSCFLTLRRDDEYVFELYSPHRFSVQFGFHQCIPGELKKPNFLPATLQEVYQLWDSCVREKTESNHIIPSCPPEGVRLALSSYDDSWFKRHCAAFSSRRKITLKSVAVPRSLPKPTKVSQYVINETTPPIPLPLVQKKVSRDCTIALGGKTVTQTHIPKSKGKSLALIGMMPKEKIVQADFEKEDDAESSSTEHHWKRNKRKTLEDGTDSLYTATNDDDVVKGLAEIPVPNWKSAAKISSHPTCSGGDSVQGPHSFDLHVAQLESVVLPATISKENQDSAKRSRIAVGRDNFVAAQHNIHHDVSVYCVDKVVSSTRRIFVVSLWDNLQRKIARTPLDKVASLVMEANKMIDAIAENKEIDCSPLRTLVGDFFRQAKKFAEVQTEFSQKITSDERAKEICVAESSIKNIHAKEDDILKGIELKQATLLGNLSRQAKLKEELESLDIANKEIEASILQADLELSEINVEASKLTTSIEVLENLDTTGKVEENQFKVLKESLEATFEELKDYRWSP